MGAKRAYKDSVFTKLFSTPKELLSLYNAIASKDFPLDTDIEIATLDDMLFASQRNDVAFILDGRLVILIEHQSTINENMPLRILVYLARIYEKPIDNEAIHRRRLIKIPKPDFIVLYNGMSPYPDEKTLRLSEAYKEAPEGGLGGKMELEVRVVNINEGRNEDIVRKCEALNGYVRLVGKTRRHRESGLELEEALKLAIKECIEEKVLAGFLEAHSSEVINMMTTPISIDRLKEIMYEDGLEDGMEKGMEKGVEKGREEGMEKGLEKGLDISAQIMQELKKNGSVEEIAKRYNVSTGKVAQLQSQLQILLAM